jgi:hypothetical protein
MKDTVLLVTGYGMGKADETLQLTLIGKYFELLTQNGDLPAAICFYTDGVKLVCEGSPVIEQLRALESKNVRLIVCSTCLTISSSAKSCRSGLSEAWVIFLKRRPKPGK